jgi:hypothetical protein
MSDRAGEATGGPCWLIGASGNKRSLYLRIASFSID